MKRGGPLKRYSTLRRSPMRPAPKKSAYKTRERDMPFIRWVWTQPCIVATLPPDPNRITPCRGLTEADHFGARPVGRKGADRTCVPMCNQHHHERSDHHGAFFNLNQAQVRAWRAQALELTALAWAASSPEGEGPQ